MVSSKHANCHSEAVGKVRLFALENPVDSLEE